MGSRSQAASSTRLSTRYTRATSRLEALAAATLATQNTLHDVFPQSPSAFVPPCSTPWLCLASSRREMGGSIANVPVHLCPSLYILRVSEQQCPSTHTILASHSPIPDCAPSSNASSHCRHYSSDIVDEIAVGNNGGISGSTTACTCHAKVGGAVMSTWWWCASPRKLPSMVMGSTGQ